jgi:DNA repair photolyase
VSVHEPAELTTLLVSFRSLRITIAYAYEPHCASIAERLETVRRLRAAGIAVYATLASC